MQEDYKIIADVSAALDEITDQDRKTLSELLVLHEWGVNIHTRLDDIWADRPNFTDPTK
jgi:hypothetical protein